MPAPRAAPTDLNAALAETLALYNDLFREIRIERRFSPALPPVRVDLEQMRRVVINLVDNGVEALGGSAASASAERRTAGDRRRDPARSGKRRRADSRLGQRPGHLGRRSRQAVHAVLLDQAARERPRPRDRSPHHRRARRQHRSRRQCSERDRVYDRAADVTL